MDCFQEALVLSANEPKSNLSCSIYELKTLKIITSFKGDSCAEKGLAFVAEDYIIAALDKQPAAKAWTLCDKTEDTNMTLPGIVSCLAVSNCGAYCVAGIDSFLFIWEISSGDLLTTIYCHTKDITCIRFSSDGTHFVSGCKAGNVCIWLMSNVIGVEIEDVRPVKKMNDHSGEITDIYIGDTGIHAHIATASTDMSCRIYELATGLPFISVHVDFVITAITRDSLQHFLILGSYEGQIYRINMFAAEDVECHYNRADIKSTFLGHSKKITSLSLSMSGKFLISGSEDTYCRLWDMTNLSCINSIVFSGPVTNAFITLMPMGLNKEQRFCPNIIFSKFKRDRNIGKPDNDRLVSARIQDQNLALFHLGSPDEYFDPRLLLFSPEATNLSDSNTSVKYVKDVSNANTQLYTYGIGETIFSIKANGKSNAHQIIKEENN